MPPGRSSPTQIDHLFGDLVDECKLLLFILEFASRPPKSTPRKRQAQRRLALEPAGKRKVTGERAGVAVAEVAEEAGDIEAGEGPSAERSFLGHPSWY